MMWAALHRNRSPVVASRAKKKEEEEEEAKRQVERPDRRSTNMMRRRGPRLRARMSERIMRIWPSGMIGRGRRSGRERRIRLIRGFGAVSGFVHLGKGVVRNVGC